MFHKLAKRQTVRIRKACVFKVLVIQDVLNQEYWSTNRENPKTIPAVNSFEDRNDSLVYSSFNLESYVSYRQS